MDIDKAIQGRISCKKFREQKPDWRDILEAVNAARYAPMAGNNYSVKFIVVDIPEKIKKFSEAAQQPWIAKAQYVVVVVSNPSRTTDSYGERGEIYCRQQAGAAIQNFLLKLEERGLSTCWVGHFVDEMIKFELGIPDDVQVEAIFPIGFKFENQKPSKVVHEGTMMRFNSYRNKKMTPTKVLDV